MSCGGQVQIIVRRTSMLVAIIVTMALALSLLTAATVKAADNPLPFIGSTVLSDTPSNTPAYFELPSETKTWCPNGYGYSWAPWVHVINQSDNTDLWESGQSNQNGWVDGGGTYQYGTGTFRLNIPANMVHYPGATLQVSVYHNCSGTRPDPTQVQPEIVGDPVNFTWDKTYAITDVHFTSYGFSSSTATAFANDPHAVVTAYAIQGYGTPSQQVFSGGGEYFGSCDIRVGLNGCETSIYRDFNEGVTTGHLVKTFGFAIMPNYLKNYNGTQWPPPGALDSQVAQQSEMDGPTDIPSISQKGPSLSEQKNRIPSGDPIDNYSGNFYANHTDISVSGRIGLTADRSYSSGTSTVSGSFGNGWTFGYDMNVSYDPATQSASVIEENGDSVSFNYNAGSNSYSAATPVIRATLTKTSQGWDFNRWSNLLVYRFDQNGSLSSITDNNANTVTIDRDQTTGKAVKASEGDRWIQFNWLNGLIQSVVDNAGRTATYTYDAQNNLIDVKGAGGADSTYAYDASHRITSMVNAIGGTMTNIYDSQGRVSEQHSPAGQVLKMTYGSPDPYLGRVSNTEVIGDTTKTFTYGKGRLISFSNTADRSQDFTQSYDKYGRLYYSKAVNDPDGAESYISYDDRGNVTNVLHPASSRSDSNTWNQRNQLLTTTDRLGVVSTNTYDGNGNLTATSQQSATGTQTRTTSYIVSPTGETTQVTNPLGGLSNMAYTDDGDLSSMTDPNGDKTTYSYDPLGRKLSTVSPGGNAAGVTDASKFTQNFTYDANDNIVTVGGPLGNTTYTYDAVGNAVSLTDPHGKSSSTTYDAGGHAIVITHADGSTDSFTYDAATGQRATWTDSQGRVTTYLKRTDSTTTTSPDGTASTVMDIYSDFSGGSHDAYLTDPFNNQTLIKHREFGNKKVTETTHIGSVQTATAYASDTGLKASEQTSNDVTSYAYDGFGNLTSSTSTVAGRNVSYAYDAAGNIVAITYPDGTSISRTLDKTGRVITLTDWSGVIYTFTYTADGKLGGVSASNGLSYQQSFDGSLPTDKTWKDGAGTALATFQSAYDAQGQLSSTANTVGGTTENNPLQWNAKDQVAKIGTSPVTWQGTHVTATDKLQSLNYSATTGRLTDTTDATGATATFTHDAIGRRTSSVSGGQTTNYSWNVLGQLIAAGTDAYSYDNSGLRSSVNGSQQVYGQDLKLLSDGTSKFLWGTDGSLLAQAPLGSGSGSSPSQAITNGMGSVYEMVQAQPVPNAPGTYGFAVQAQYSYSLFGERTLVAGTDVTTIGYVSEQIDTTTGFIYLRARYYDPKTAQFISSDPLLIKTLDEYGYASGNPLQLIDPLGLDSAHDVAKFIYDNADNLSLIATGLALACTATGVGAPVGAAFIATGYALNVVATIKSARENDSLGVGLGVAGMLVPGVSKAGKLVAEFGLSKTTQAVVEGSIVSRREFNSAIGGYNSSHRLTKGFELYSNLGSMAYTGRQTLEKINNLRKCG